MKPGFKPMLAAALEEADLPRLQWPVFASAKLDGIRAVVVDGVIMSRNLRPIANKALQARYGRKEYNGLDGELIAGDPCDPACMRNTTSAVMARDAESSHVRFHVFDSFSNSVFGYAQRNREAKQRQAGLDGVVWVEQRSIGSAEALLAFEEECLTLGYEGLMVRNGTSGYKFGRGTLSKQDLMKFKRFADAEAVVLGAYERQHNGNAATTDALGRTKRTTHQTNKTGLDTLGGFHVRGINGPYKDVEFDVGTGWTDNERAALWEETMNAHSRGGLNGRTLKYKYFPTGGDVKPRFPVFLVWRSDGA
jgi:DNA ligase-1